MGYENVVKEHPVQATRRRGDLAGHRSDLGNVADGYGSNS